MDNNQLVNLNDLCFYACSIYDDSMYFFTEKSNIFVKMDMHNYKTELLCYEDKGNDVLDEKTAFLLSYGSSIFRLQLNDRRVIEYKLDSNETFFYDIKESKRAYGNFSYMTIYGDYLYLFPGCVLKVIIIDLKHKKIINKIDISDIVKKYNLFGEDEMYWEKGCLSDNTHVMLYAKNRREIFCFDLINNVYEIVCLPKAINGVIDICQIENGLCILDSQNNLYEWDCVNNEVELMAEFIEKYDELYFSRIVNTCNKIILLPSIGGDIFIFDKKDKVFSVYHNYPGDFEYIGYAGWGKYNNECQMGNCIYFPMRRSNYVLKIDKQTGDLEWIKPIPPLKANRAQYYIDKKVKYFNENGISLEEFIHVVTNGDDK